MGKFDVFSLYARIMLAVKWSRGARAGSFLGIGWAVEPQPEIDLLCGREVAMHYATPLQSNKPTPTRRLLLG